MKANIALPPFHSPANAKCPHYFTKEEDALRQRWHGTAWMNPPYGREIAAFMRKAYQESIAGATVVCSVLSCAATDWWHRYAKCGQVIYLRGRLRFDSRRGWIGGVIRVPQRSRLGCGTNCGCGVAFC